MGEAASKQRERMLKGIEGEFLAMDYFDKKQIPYFAIEQQPHTWSQALCSDNIKRPDFIIWNAHGQRRLVDVKNYTVHETTAMIQVDHSDVRSLEKNANSLGMEPLLAFVLERRYLAFVKLQNLEAPAISGQRHTLEMVAGPSDIPEGFRPKWLPRNKIVAWDTFSSDGMFLNKLSDPAPLFA